MRIFIPQTVISEVWNQFLSPRRVDRQPDQGYPRATTASVDLSLYG